MYAVCVSILVHIRCAKTMGDRHGHNRTNRTAEANVHMNRKIYSTTTPPFSTAVIVCAQVCVQRVLLSIITEVENACL